MRIIGLSTRLRLAVLWPAVAALAAAGPILWTLNARPLERGSEKVLLETLQLLVPPVEELLATAEGPELQRAVEKLGGESSLRMTVIANDGTVLADSSLSGPEVARMENHRDRPEVVAARQKGTGTSVRRSSSLRVDFVYAARTVKRPGEAPCVLRVALPLEQLGELRAGLAGALLLASAAAIVVMVVIALWLDRGLFLPLQRIMKGASELSSGDLSVRVPVPKTPEIRSLAESLNDLATRAQTQIGQLATERDDLKEILGSMTEGVQVTDERGRVRLENASFRRFLGDPVDRDEPSPGRLRVAELVRQALADGETRAARCELADPVRYLALVAVPMRGTVGAVVVAHDETGSIREAKSRRDLVANVSHELKTPLTAIRGFAETLQDGALQDPDTAARFTGRILDQCQRLEQLLQDLLSLSRAESLVRRPGQQEVDLRQILEEALEILEPTARHRDVRLTLEGPHLAIPGDAKDIEVMVINLLENAIKYNRTGGSVHIRLEETRGGVLLEVSDTGIGIPEADRSRIFERFYRVDKARSREAGGTGLGLAIVKHAARRHGGTVEIESRIGEGSTFRIRLAGPGSQGVSE